MAGTLTVQNIQGPSSGVNANKIIIPSGQTLDASAGGMTLPAGVGGKLLQTVLWTIPATAVSTSGSWAVTTTPSLVNTYTVAEYSFTKQQSDSNVLCIASGHVDHANSAGTPTIVALFETGSSTLLGSGYRHIRFNNDEPFPYAFSGLDTSTGTSKTYRLTCMSSGGPMYFSRMVSGDHGHSKFTVTLLEIAG